MALEKLRQKKFYWKVSCLGYEGQCSVSSGQEVYSKLKEFKCILSASMMALEYSARPLTVIFLYWIWFFEKWGKNSHEYVWIKIQEKLFRDSEEFGFFLSIDTNTFYMVKSSVRFRDLYVTDMYGILQIGWFFTWCN